MNDSHPKCIQASFFELVVNLHLVTTFTIFRKSIPRGRSSAIAEWNVVAK